MSDGEAGSISGTNQRCRRDERSCFSRVGKRQKTSSRATDSVIKGLCIRISGEALLANCGYLTVYPNQG